MNDYLHLFFKLVSSKLFNDFRELKIGIIHMFGSQSNRSDLIMSRIVRSQRTGAVNCEIRFCLIT